VIQGPYAEGQFLQIVVPIRTDPKLALSTLKSKLSIEFSYEKSSSEVFVAQNSIDLKFAHPFHISPCVVPLQNRIYFQFLLDSIDEGLPIQINKSVLTVETDDDNIITKGFSLFLNGYQVLLAPGKKFSLLFEAKTFYQEKVRQKLEVQFSLLPHETNLYDNEMNSFIFYWTPVIPPMLYSVDLFFPETATVGSLVNFSFIIMQIAPFEHEPISSIQYEINLDHRLWMLDGHKKSTIQFEHEKTHEINCRLIPITTGFIPVPQLHISGLDSSQVLNTHAEMQIFIFPSKSFVSSLI